MKRYSNLYGTIYANAAAKKSDYAFLGGSENLPGFIKDQNATNMQAVVAAVQQVLAGFPNSDSYRMHYVNQPQGDLPVSVRYAPMHLRNHPDMPNTIQPFTALAVNGNENKAHEGDVRYSTYVQTFFIDREHMHKTVTEKYFNVTVAFNYLDQIFGTHLLDYTEVALVRNQKHTLDYNAIPDKVEPKMKTADAEAVFQTVDAVFDNKVVLILLEKGCDFNKRAIDLLLPIYSLLPPRLATEIGFATYLSPLEIPALVKNTSMRIFVMPSECDLERLDTSSMLVLDMNRKISKTLDDQMRNVLVSWNKLPWAKRQPAMEHLFEDTLTAYSDKRLFIDRSADFFDQVSKLGSASWLEKGALSTLQELKNKYDSLPLCAVIPWMKETFVTRAPSMMKERGAIHKLTGRALAEWKINKDESAKKLYEFGVSMGGTDPRAMADAACALTDQKVRSELAMDILGLKNQVTDLERQKNTEVAQAKAAGENAVREERIKANAAIAAEQAKTRKAIEDSAAELKAEQQKYSRMKQQLDSELLQAQKDYENARDRYLREQSEHQAALHHLDTTRRDLERANQDIRKLQTEKRSAEEKLASADVSLEESRALLVKAENVRAEAVKLKTKSDKIIRTGNMRMIISAAVGFLIATLIFGVGFIIMNSIKGSNPDGEVPPTDTTTPTVQVSEVFTEETTEATEETNEATEETNEATEETNEATEETTKATEETTKATEETNDSGENNSSEKLDIQRLKEQVPGIEIDSNFENLPEAVKIVEDYIPAAVIRPTEQNTESYSVIMEKMDTVENGPGQGRGGRNEATISAVRVEGALAVLTSEEYVLVVYGEEALNVSLDAYGYLVTNEEDVLSVWTLNEDTLDLDEMMFTFTASKQWWRGIQNISHSEEKYDAAKTKLGTTYNPIAVFAFEKNFEIILFELENGTYAEALNEKLLQAQHQATMKDNLVAVMLQ